MVLLSRKFFRIKDVIIIPIYDGEYIFVKRIQCRKVTYSSAFIDFYT